MGVDDNIEFDYPHGMQTEITGLQSWLGVSSWRQTLTTSENNLQGVEVRTDLPPNVEIGEHNGYTLSFRSSWKLSSRDERGRIVLHDLLYCVTESTDSVAWADQEQPHLAIRDLLVLSRWHDETCIPVKAQRQDDLLLTHGEATSKQIYWRNVVVPGSIRANSPVGHRPHLIEYQDIGPEGVMRWLALRDEFSRVIDPVVTSIGLRGTTPNTLLAHTGPALEALGYLLILRDNGSTSKARESTLKQRFERILDDLGNCLPFDTTGWPARTAEVYNGIKHANRKEPERLNVLNAWRECILIVRAWVAIELGVPLESIKDKLRQDPQRHKYISLFDD